MSHEGGESAGAVQPGVMEIARDCRLAPARMWEMWTTAEGLSRWWWNHWQGVRFDIDARLGGHYLIEAADKGIRVSGNYLVFDQPRRLAFTWVWSDREGTSPDEVVHVAFEPLADGTRVLVRHSGPWRDATPAENYRQGWQFVLGALAEAAA